MKDDHYHTAVSIVQTLHNQGFIAYFAGGWVRDHLLGHISDDIDIVTNASVDELKVIFQKTIPVGQQFGIMVVVENDYQFEVASFRKESGYLDGRRPSQVEEASPEEDAQRRDYTINGMFFDPLAEVIYDYVGGQKDLKGQVVKAIGDPHLRINEDRLRMLRAIRYACRFQFTIDPPTYEAIKAHAKELFPAVAIERVWQELSKMAAFPHFPSALTQLFDTGLLQTILPCFATLTKHELDTRMQGMESLPRTTPPVAKLCLLFDSITPSQIADELKRLKLSNKEIDFALYFTQLKEIFIREEQLSRYQRAMLYANPHFELCFEILKQLPIDAHIIEIHTAHHIDLLPHIHKIETKSPVVTAKMLSEYGVPNGVEMGNLLKEATKLSIEENLVDPDLLIPRILPETYKPKLHNPRRES